jgi:hypothetical protein
MKKSLIVLSFFLAGNVSAGSRQSLFADVLVHKPVAIDAEKLAAAELVISPDNKCSFYEKITNLHNKGKLIEPNIIPFLESKNIPVGNWTYHPSHLMVWAIERASNIRKCILGKGLECIEGESNLTPENITILVNEYHKSEHNPEESFDTALIIELLKERRNILVQQMNAQMWKQINKSGIGDIRTEERAIFAAYGLVLLCFKIPFLHPKGIKDNSGLVGFQQGIGFSLAIVNLNALRCYRNEIRSIEKEMSYIDQIIERIESFKKVENA